MLDHHELAAAIAHVALLRLPGCTCLRLRAADPRLVSLGDNVIVQLSVVAELFNRLSVLRAIKLDVLLHLFAFVLQDVPLTGQLLDVIFNFLLCRLDGGHLALQLVKSRLLLVNFGLAVFLDFRARRAVRQQLLPSNIVLLEFFRELGLRLIQLLDIFLRAGNLLV